MCHSWETFWCVSLWLIRARVPAKKIWTFSLFRILFVWMASLNVKEVLWTSTIYLVCLENPSTPRSDLKVHVVGGQVGWWVVVLNLSLVFILGPCWTICLPRIEQLNPKSYKFEQFRPFTHFTLFISHFNNSESLYIPTPYIVSVSTKYHINTMIDSSEKNIMLMMVTSIALEAFTGDVNII